MNAKRRRGIAVLAVTFAFFVAVSLFLGLCLRPASVGAAPLRQEPATPTPPPMLDVLSAEPVTCGGVYTGTNETGQNNVTTYGCRPWWDESGKEKVYRLELNARQPVTVTLLNATADLDLFLLRYALPDSCQAAGDNYLTYSADMGPYFLSVDGFRGATGSYTFRVDCPADAQATPTPTFTPSVTPTSTATGMPPATHTPTSAPTPMRSYLPLVLRGSIQPTPWPVTFILQDGVDGYEGTTDTTLSSWEPAAPHGDETELHIHYAHDAQISNQLQPAVRFDLRLLPKNAVIHRALLRLYVPATPLHDIRGQVAGLLRSWTEGSATWLQAEAGQPWALPGAASVGSDRSTWASEPQRIVEGSRWYEFDVSALVQDWSTFPTHNFGMVVGSLAGDSNANVEARFVSREGSPAFRPQLVISYTLPVATTGQ